MHKIIFKCETKQTCHNVPSWLLHFCVQQKWCHPDHMTEDDLRQASAFHQVDPTRCCTIGAQTRSITARSVMTVLATTEPAHLVRSVQVASAAWMHLAHRWARSVASSERPSHSCTSGDPLCWLLAGSRRGNVPYSFARSGQAEYLLHFIKHTNNRLPTK